MDTIPAVVTSMLIGEGQDPNDPLVETAYLAARDIATDCDEVLAQIPANDEDVARWTLIIIHRVPAFQRQ